VNIEGDVALI
jgi:hypothetical protein